MRRIFIILFLLVAIIIGAVVAAVYLVPVEVYKEKIEQQASAAIGRQVEINGDISFVLFPNISVKAANVRIANPDGFSGNDFASMDEMKVGVKLIPLFSRQVEISEFVLVRPKISLEKLRNNAINWALGAGDASSTRASANQGFSRVPGALPLEASLGNVRIIDGKASYHDHANNQKTNIDAINLQLKLPSLDKKMSLNGDVSVNGTAYTLSLGLASLRGFLEGAQTAVTLAVASDFLRFSFDGAFAQSEDLELAGTMNIDVPSLQKLAKEQGQTFSASPGTFENFSVTGFVKGRPNHLSFDNANLVFDNIKATGKFSAQLGGATPKFSGNLRVARLDLNPYLPPPPAKSITIAPWADDTLSMEPLRAANGNFTLDVDSILVRNIEFGATTLQTNLVNGRLEANLTKTSLYGGAGTGQIVLNGRGRTPSFSMKFNIADVEALPLFDAATGFNRLSGTGELAISLLTSGTSVDAMMNNLSGTTNLHLSDGAILGINLANVLRNAQTYLLTGALPANLNTQEKTDFSSLQGSFNIAGGVARNTDMLMVGPLVRVTGNGQVDLGQQTLDYRITPKAVASLQGQGGKTDLSGLSAPFRIHGSWNNVKAGIDTKALAEIVANQAKTQVRKLIGDNIGGDVGKVLQGLLGPKPEPTAQPTSEPPTEKSDEEKALETLGNLFGFGKKQEPPTEEAKDGDE